VGGLAGFTVVVASERRRHSLAELLKGQGVRTINLQATRSVAQPVIAEIAAATRLCLAAPVHELVISSAAGLRAWLRVAREADDLDAIVSQLGQTRLLVHDPRAAQILRRLGLRRIWTITSSTPVDHFRYLLTQPMPGRRVVAQIESEAHREYCEALRRGGADVVEVMTNRFLPPPRIDALRRIAELAVHRQVDAIALTGPATTGNLLRQADLDGILPDLVNAFSGDVAAVCLGESAGRSLREHGISPAVASHPDDISFCALLCAHLPSGSLTLTVEGQAVHIRSQTIVIGNEIIAVQPAPMAVLRALARRPGQVLSATSIRRDYPLWSGVDDHAVEMAVSRLRGTLSGTVLKHASLVQTVNRRGYRIAV
jgi:uroporphyrinogen-III synthase